MQQSPNRTDQPSPTDLPDGARVEGVAATARGLLRATLGAAALAAVILVLFWLPAEYGVDPTGLGKAMGLTQMGEIKQQLYAEADADHAGAADEPDGAVLQRLDAIESQLADIMSALEGAATAAQPQPTTGENAPATIAANAAALISAPADDAWRDEVSYTLAPGEGVEVKLVMQERAVAQFYWTANGALLNHDTHGHGSGQRITYERGRSVAEQDATLEAAFTGNHGWFWRNRTEAPVTLTLRTRGDYSELKAP